MLLKIKRWYYAKRHKLHYEDYRFYSNRAENIFSKYDDISVKKYEEKEKYHFDKSVHYLRKYNDTTTN